MDYRVFIFDECKFSGEIVKETEKESKYLKDISSDTINYLLFPNVLFKENGFYFDEWLHYYVKLNLKLNLAEDNKELECEILKAQIDFPEFFKIYHKSMMELVCHCEICNYTLEVKE